MSMVDPSAQQPPTNVLPPAPEAPPEPTPIHPSWEASLAAVPDMLRGPIYEQIRTTETESQKAIEKARAESVPDEWRSFVTEATQQNIQPGNIVEAWNSAQALQADPVGFSIRLNDIIDQRMQLPASDPNHLTKQQGYRAKVEAAAAIQEELDPLTPPADPRVAELESQVTQLTADQTRRAQQEQAQAQAQQADQFATVFMGHLNTATEGATPEQKQLIGRAASDLLFSDTTGRLTPETAIANVLTQAKAAGLTFAPPAAAPVVPAQQLAPVSAGSGGAMPQAPATPLPAGNSKEARAAREQRMLAAAATAMAQPGDA